MDNDNSVFSCFFAAGVVAAIVGGSIWAYESNPISESSDQKAIAETMAENGIYTSSGEVVQFKDCSGRAFCNTSITYRDGKYYSVLRSVDMGNTHELSLDPLKSATRPFVYREVLTPSLETPKYKWGCLGNQDTGKYTCYYMGKGN